MLQPHPFELARRNADSEATVFIGTGRSMFCSISVMSITAAVDDDREN
jgi:hypothetical protein